MGIHQSEGPTHQEKTIEIHKQNIEDTAQVSLREIEDIVWPDTSIFN